MIMITPSAEEKIVDLLIEENNPKVFLRIAIQGGGCSGMQYQFQFDETLNEDDQVQQMGNYQLVIDSISMQYLQGAKIDYKEELMSSEFVIDNPNAITTCGCGSSFGI